MTTTSKGIECIAFEELNKRVDRAMALLEEVQRLFPDLATLTTDERRRSEGRFKSDESSMLAAVLDAVDLSPHYFVSLADRDHGEDPTKLETTLLRERLARRDLLDELSEKLEKLATDFSDTVLQLGARVRPVTLAAYQIGKVVATSDHTLRSKIAPVIDYYSRPARLAAETRAAKKHATQ